MSTDEAYREILLRLEGLTPKAVPLTDPSINVERRVGGAVNRLDDLRVMEAQHFREMLGLERIWRNKVDDLRDQAAKATAVAESERVNALRAGDAANVALALQRVDTAALALANTVTTSAEALRDAAAITRDAQDKSIAALQLIQATGSGGITATEKAQAVRGLTVNQLLIAAGVIIALLVALSGHVRLI
jgi:hypothetical protein